jgi:ketosteroid isomerase-like protein
MASSPKDLVNRYYHAINEATWAAYDELFTPDVALEAPGGVTGTGIDAVRGFDQIWKEAAADFTVTPLLQVQTGESVLSENLAWGTQTGVLRTPVGEIAPTGREFGSKYVGVFEFRDGRISAQRIYFDRMVVVEMLGMPVPAPVG